VLAALAVDRVKLHGALAVPLGGETDDLRVLGDLAKADVLLPQAPDVAEHRGRLNVDHEMTHHLAAFRARGRAVVVWGPDTVAAPSTVPLTSRSQSKTWRRCLKYSKTSGPHSTGTYCQPSGRTWTTAPPLISGMGMREPSGRMR